MATEPRAREGIPSTVWPPPPHQLPYRGGGGAPWGFWGPLRSPGT